MHGDVFKISHEQYTMLCLNQIRLVNCNLNWPAPMRMSTMSNVSGAELLQKKKIPLNNHQLIKSSSFLLGLKLTRGQEHLHAWLP